MIETKRRWSDGDTYVAFGLLVLVCGVAIAWRASDPDNWRTVENESPMTAVTWQHPPLELGRVRPPE